MIKEFRNTGKQRAEEYSKFAGTFKSGIDYFTGYTRALEDVQEEIDQSETYQKGFVALQEAVLKSAEKNKELVEMLGRCKKSLDWIYEKCPAPVLDTQEEVENMTEYVFYRRQEIKTLLHSLKKGKTDAV
ncbi:MAG TPA: hypothetical protein VNR38_00970 [Ureibacillus sp.]|nr:hypothetical protein [Ureibacillus sp.]